MYSTSVKFARYLRFFCGCFTFGLLQVIPVKELLKGRRQVLKLFCYITSIPLLI
jgi:hypothetical protein